MASIWVLNSGEKQISSETATNTREWCEAYLDLRQSQWREELQKGILVSGKKSALGGFKEYSYVIVKLDGNDIQGTNWKSGYYLVDKNHAQLRKALATNP
jgi:hypothetical protein